MTGAILRGLYVLRKYGLPALAIMVVTFLSFGSMLRAQFAADDYLLIVANTSIQSLTSLPKLFTSSYIPGQGLYRPLSSATFAVNYAIGHLNPAGYHLTNVLLHALNGFLVYLLVQYYTGRKPIALLSSLVFIAHPVHTEAVSNIAGRPELLAAGAILVAWLLYVREEQHYYWLSLAAYFLGLLAKESAIVLVGILVLADVCEGRSAERLFTRVRLNRYGGYIAVSGLYLLIRILVLHRVGVPTGATVFKDASLQTRVLTMSVVFTRYLKLLIWPGELTALYDFSIVPLTSHLTVQAAVSIAGIIALLAFGILCIRQQPLVAFAVLFVFVTLSPVSNVIFPTGILMAERVLYLPVLSFCVLFAAAVDILSQPKLLWRTAAVGTFCVIQVAAMMRDYRRNADWFDQIAYDRSLVQTLPNSPLKPQILEELGARLTMAGQYPEALGYLKTACELSPKSADAAYDVGLVLEKLNRPDEALQYLRKAAELTPNDAEIQAHYAAAAARR